MASVISVRRMSLSLGELRTIGVRNVSGELLVVLMLAALGLILHGLNMFQYPSFTGSDDEGIYAAQAWAVLREGQLSPYTYVYDHVPGGWLLVAAWMALTGGPHAFGGAIDSGRALMLLIHVASLLILYRVARKLGCGVATAALACVLFSASPLGLAYQRRLLLDNIMLFWCLLSLDLLLDGWGRLSRVTLSGICFGIALLTKETAIFLVLPMLYIAWQQRWEHQARFAVFGWLVPMAVVVSWYPLYAALKGELLPASGSVHFSTSGYGNAGVSLFDSLVWQIGRDGGGAFNFDNQFWSLMRSDWLPRDPLLLYGGGLAILGNVAIGLRGQTVVSRRALATGLLGVLPLLYLARGGIVFDFYVLVAIPFVCLNVAALVEHGLGQWRHHPPPATLQYEPWGVTQTVTRSVTRSLRSPQLVTVSAVCLALLAVYAQSGTLQPALSLAPSAAGRDASGWIKTHVPADASIVVRDDLWTDLREPGQGGPGFANVHSYTKLAGDPAVRGGVFAEDWRRIDYLVVSPGLLEILTASGNTLALQALDHAHRVKAWSTDGNTLEVWKVDKPASTEANLLRDAGMAIRHRFERNGAFALSDGTVTSESEAYALLRAVWSDDRETFDRTWRWSKTHLLNANGVLAWKWNGSVLDTHSATDADTDTALALLMAGRRWANPAWEFDGTLMVKAIWDNDLARVGDEVHVGAGDWAPGLAVLAVNPSYFAPYAYHTFQEVDPEHDWLRAIDSGYRLLFAGSADELGNSRSAGLPPDWLGIDRATGRIVPLSLGMDDTTAYAFDAPRTYWRIALDLRWTNDGRALAYLEQAGFLRDEVQRAGFVRAMYGHDGSVGSSESSVVASAGGLAALLTLDPAAASQLYAGQLLGGLAYVNGEPHWGDGGDLYAQEWGWFATGLYADALVDVFHRGQESSS